MTPERIDPNHWNTLGVRCELGECPTWHADEGRLYWLDIPNGRLHAYRLRDAQRDAWTLPEPASSLAFTIDGDLLLTPEWGFALWKLGAADWEALAEPERGSPNRFNDGAVDPAGRFWTATLNPDQTPTNHLFRFRADAPPARMDGEIRAGNGIAWTSDARTMHLVDSGARTIRAYDFDLASGTISGRREWARFAANEGTPDGIAMDAEDHLWCALWGGRSLVRLDPDGQTVERRELPVSHPTSCAFVGPELRTLAVTSAGPPHCDHDEPMQGDVLLLDLDTPGLPLSSTWGGPAG